MTNKLYLLLFILLNSSCAVNYFIHNIPNDVAQIIEPQVYHYFPEGFPTEYENYQIEMQSLFYYKNNVREDVLMTKNSQLIENIQFFPQTDGNRPDKFQRFEIWIAKRNHSSNPSKFDRGENAIMISYKGKNTINGEMYELVKVYMGKIDTIEAVIKNKDSTLVFFKPELLLAYTGKCYKVKRKISKKELNMEAFIDFVSKETLPYYLKNTAVIEFRALVDKNHNAIGGEKDMIFDMSQIYGEPIWLIKK